MILRRAEPEDHAFIIRVIDDWWDGREMRHLLPVLFFEHFNDTSFVVEEDGGIVAFLVGFVSQSRSGEAYIHFVGVRPDHRQRGLGRMLYERFFEVAREHARSLVRSVTAPGNRGSIAFHTAMGFAIEPGDGEVRGVPVHLNHDGPGVHRVRFSKRI